MTAGKLVALLLVALGANMGAQGTASIVARADSLVGFGALARAESLYYAAVNERPRDPIARAALGRYLGSRGAYRIALVLLDEARRFGADPRSVARDLLPVQRAAGEFGAIAGSSAAGLAGDERARARWLVDHPPSLTMPDSVVVALARARQDRAGAIGVVRMVVNGRAMDAVVDPGAAGFVAGSGIALRRFGAHAVADSVTIGGVRMRNVAIRLDTAAEGITIGLDQLLRFAPTIRPGRALVLRRGGRLPADLAGTTIPFRFAAATPSPQFLVGGLWRAFDAPALAAMHDRPWHIDGRRGRLVVDR